MTDTAENFASLKALWAAQFPKKANGGWWGLSGFSIQMTAALEKFVREGLGKDDVAFAVEAVSDVLLASSAELQLSQVKRTLTTTTLNAALAEAYDIASLCSHDLLEKITFQVVCERMEPSVDFATARPTKVEGKIYDPALLARTKERFDANAPIRVLSHPRLALRRALANVGVKNPEGVAKEALGFIFDAFDGRDPKRVQQAVYDVIALIDKEKGKNAPSAGVLLSAADFQPVSDERSKIVLRYKPRVHDLAQRRVIDRPMRLPTIEAAASAWLDDLEAAYGQADDVLPVFWLDGRPGDGKSVLALQLLDRLLVRKRLVSVVELQKPGELEAWLETAPEWRPRTSDPEQLELGFVDDLAGMVSADQMGQIIERGFRRPPYAGLVTCGVTDHMKSFDPVAARVVITRCTVAAPAEADYRQFSNWLIEQGKLTKVQPAESGESLAAYIYRLVSLEGDSQHKGMRERLQALSAYAPAQVALALNSLAIRAPTSVLSDTAIAVFAEGDGDIEFSPDTTADGVQLGHAEVIWSLFKQWAGADQEPLVSLWARSLGMGLVALVETGSVTAARTLLGEILDTGKLIRLLGKADVEDHQRVLFNTLYAAAVAHLSLAQRARLMRQFLVAQMARRLTVVERETLRLEAYQSLKLASVPTSDRVEVALALLIGKEVPEGIEVEAAADAVLASQPTPIAIQFFSQIARKGEGSRHRPLLISWLQRHRDRLEIAKVLELAIANGDPAPLLDIGYAFVWRFCSEPSSGLVLWALHRANKPHKRYYATVTHWLVSAPNADIAGRLYQDLLRPKVAEDFATRALNWAADHLEARGVHAVLMRLIPVRESDPKFDKTVAAWCEENLGTSFAPALLVDLLDRGSLTHWAPLAMHYLDSFDGNPGSQLVKASLIAAIKASDQETLDAIGARFSQGEASIYKRMCNLARIKR